VSVDSVWIHCSVIGCPNGIGVWHGHADNFRDRFICPECLEVGSDDDD
jgi:hypothetical protein